MERLLSFFDVSRVFDRRNPFYLRTKYLESVFVAVFLAVSFFLGGMLLRDFAAAIAVYFTFKHAQIADRMREQEEVRPMPSVSCAAWLDRFYVLKEVSWIAFFVISGSFPALVGAFLFLAYPLWRRTYRKRWPIGRNGE